MLTTDCPQSRRQLKEAGASNLVGYGSHPDQEPDVDGTQGSAAFLHGVLNLAEQFRFGPREIRQINSKLYGERAGPAQ